MVKAYVYLEKTCVDIIIYDVDEIYDPTYIQGITLSGSPVITKENNRIEKEPGTTKQCLPLIILHPL